MRFSLTSGRRKASSFPAAAAAIRRLFEKGAGHIPAIREPHNAKVRLRRGNRLAAAGGGAEAEQPALSDIVSEAPPGPPGARLSEGVNGQAFFSAPQSARPASQSEAADPL